VSWFWPKSLLGQMLLAVAIALFLVQGFGAMLVYRAQAERREAAMIHGAAFRVLSHARGPALLRGQGMTGDAFHRGARASRIELATASPLRPGEARDREAEGVLGEILEDQGLDVEEVNVAYRRLGDDGAAMARAARRAVMFNLGTRDPEDRVLVAGIRLDDDRHWLVTRIASASGERLVVWSVLSQTLLIYVVIVGAIALILRRITRPLAALTGRLERFAERPNPEGQLEPQGPDDVRRLIVAHNAMEGRIAALLDEKDVMLGAIGHDLKTPLAALRVRIESVENDAERERMAATIEDITRSLDDILSLARVGRPSDPREQAELSALVASVVEEYEDMGEQVELADTQRIALPLRSTWLRRALRNLIGNALRYGRSARVSVRREGGWAAVAIEDDGPGIAEGEIARMLLPFTRGEPSRNSETGGAGLGLTLARAIAEQHGGSLDLVNRRSASGAVEGLTATLRLPIG
jgi:signal transduction histidine kinase